MISTFKQSNADSRSISSSPRLVFLHLVPMYGKPTEIKATCFTSFTQGNQDLLFIQGHMFRILLSVEQNLIEDCRLIC